LIFGGRIENRQGGKVNDAASIRWVGDDDGFRVGSAFIDSNIPNQVFGMPEVRVLLPLP